MVFFSKPILSQESACNYASRFATGITGNVSPYYSELEDRYDVIHYFIDIEVSDTSTYLKGNTAITIRITEPLSKLVFEFDSALEADSIFVDSVACNFSHNGELLEIETDEILQPGSILNIKVYYKGGQDKGGFFNGVSNRFDQDYGNRVTYTLSEPFLAKAWFPVKQNLLDKADSVRVYLTTDSTLLAGSNGRLENKTGIPGGKIRYEWISHYPIAFYLISFSVSDYIEYNLYAQNPYSEDSILIQNYIYNDPDIIQNEKGKIDVTAKILEYYSEIFGEYPFSNEKYGHSMAPLGGGMEHQTMTTLQNFNFELVAHELAHQWFGDNVTCASWKDIWINEGFASYSEYLALEKIRGKYDALAWMARAHNLALNYPDESIYLTDSEAKDPNRIFNTAITYKKGASILNMLRYEINDDVTFFNTLKAFQDSFKNCVATADDYLTIVNRVTGEDFHWFFDQWYYGKAYPRVQAVWKKNLDSLRIETYQWSGEDDPLIFKMHIDYRINFTDGSDTIIRVLTDKSYGVEYFKFSHTVESVQIDPWLRNLMRASINEYFDSRAVEIKPNPFMDYLHFRFNNELSDKEIQILNLSGKVLFHEVLGKVTNTRLDLSFLAKGLYIVLITEDRRQIASRIVKI